jgi:predicted permease
MVALISHRLWQSRFNGDRSVVGRTFDAYVNDRPNEVETFTVMGVMPQGHWHLNAFTDVMAPLRVTTYPYIVRLKRGVNPAVAADRITALVRPTATGQPEGWRVELQSTHAGYVQQIRPLLLAVAIATALVLLIACANVGVLLTVRATRRRREMAVRQALGATAAQITRACAAEPLLLGFTAVIGGLALAWGTITMIGPVMDHYLGRPVPGGASTLHIDPLATLITIGAGLLAIVICSIVPIVVARRTPVSMVLGSGQKGGTEGPAQRRARSVLIAIEVAACLTLLIGAGLTIRSAVGILRVDMGLDVNDVIVGRFNLRQRAYPDAAARYGFFDRVLTRAGEVPSAQGIAFTNSWPLQQGFTRDVGTGDVSAPPSMRAGVVGVSPDYFNVLRIRLHEGRVFGAQDRVGTERVAVVSRTLAQRLWPSGSAIGQQLHIAPPPNSAPTARPLSVAVVGVVGDTRYTHSDNDLADVYLALMQAPSAGVFVYMRAPTDAAGAERDLRRLLASLDGDVGLAAPRQLAEILDLQRAGSRLLGYVLMVFAAFAAILALVGIYGVIAYTVKQREREIAVRLAMGADRRLITRMFLAQGSVVLIVGLVLGVAGAVGLGRVLQAQLFGVEPADPTVIAGMTAAFALCGLIAIAWPARTAASLDPANALKE